MSSENGPDSKGYASGWLLKFDHASIRKRSDGTGCSKCYSIIISKIWYANGHFHENCQV